MGGLMCDPTWACIQVIGKRVCIAVGSVDYQSSPLLQFPRIVLQLCARTVWKIARGRPEDMPSRNPDW